MADIVLESPFGPKWLAGDKINELEFCKAFLEQHPMICIHGTFFTTDGRVTDENKLKKKILEWISPGSGEEGQAKLSGLAVLPVYGVRQRRDEISL